MDHHDRSPLGFRDRKIAASLKLRCTPLDNAPAGVFPRSKDRGLIEARVSMALLSGTCSFPRSKDRGLIEARLVERVTEVVTSFRDRKIAASLKLRPQRPGRCRSVSFPRSKDRGLIEACGRRLLHSGCRTRFRDRKIAASLKRFSQDAHSELDHGFRDRKIAASLKQVGLGALFQRLLRFRDRKIAASLKPRRRSGCRE